jgi:PglZ domain
MNPLREYLEKLLGESVTLHSPLVWYDPGREFGPFLAEATRADGMILAGGQPVPLIRFDGSLIAVRLAAEPFIADDDPRPLIVYIDTRRDPKESLLMELEAAGTKWEPQLKRLARNVLRERFTDGVIDERLAAEEVTYDDLARMAAQGYAGESASALRLIYGEVSNDAIIAAWLVSDAHDAEIESKGAKNELLKLFATRLGADLPGNEPLARTRSKLRRYILASEFRLDLRGAAPACIAAEPYAAKAEYQGFARTVAARTRRDHGNAYATLADGVQRELGLSPGSIDASKLGSIDTFRFEEAALLHYCDDRIASGFFDDVLEIVRERETSFWVGRDVRRKAQWDACRAVAEVARLSAETRKKLNALGDRPGTWVDAYCAPEGLYRLDRAYRVMETLVSSMDEEVEVDRALPIVRDEYESILAEMARRFSAAFVAAGWEVPGVLRQTECYAKVVAQQSGLTAYIFVDAMRYEMGAALRERLSELGEPQLVPAVAAVPTITPMGMAALLPGAEASYSVVAEKGKLGARIDGSFLPGVVERRKFLAARVPGAVDLTLDQVLSDSKASLKRKIEGAALVNVRSQEIDYAGESGFVQHARQLMDSVLNNLARAVRKLAGAGVGSFVIAADHGHQFSVAKDESMRIDAPGGDEVDLHRRFWAGRGGTTPPGCVRVTAAALGYDSDLDFVFPINLGIFRSGGDEAFHHGAITLQELIVPVLTLQYRGSTTESSASKETIVVSGVPYEITNHMPTVLLAQRQSGFQSMKVRPVLMAAQIQVGKARVALGAELDLEKGVVTLGSQPVTVGIQIDPPEGLESVRIVVFDAENDTILYQSPDIAVKLIL